MVEGRGRPPSFIQLQSGGRPVHARCPIRRAPNPGGQTARTEITRITIFLSFFLSYNRLFK